MNYQKNKEILLKLLSSQTSDEVEKIINDYMDAKIQIPEVENKLVALRQPQTKEGD